VSTSYAITIQELKRTISIVFYLSLPEKLLSTSFWPQTLTGNTQRDIELGCSHLFLCVTDGISLHIVPDCFDEIVDKIQNTFFPHFRLLLQQYRCQSAIITRMASLGFGHMFYSFYTRTQQARQ
jgi:hypothetical protein